MASPVTSIDRALSVLETLADAGARGMPLAELANTLGENKATVHRALAALKHRGFVDQAIDGSYLLGIAATALAARFYSEDNLPHLMRPALTALCEASDELVHLGVLRGTRVVYLDKVEPDRAVRVWSSIGRGVPALTTALGRSLLAAMNTDSLADNGEDKAIIERFAAQEQAGKAGNIAARAEIDRSWNAIKAARRNGYAIEREENEPGISCLGVPLLANGRPVAAISITAPSERLQPKDEEPLYREVLEILPKFLPRELELFLPD